MVAEGVGDCKQEKRRGGDRPPRGWWRLNLEHDPMAMCYRVVCTVSSDFGRPLWSTMRPLGRGLSPHLDRWTSWRGTRGGYQRPRRETVGGPRKGPRWRKMWRVRGGVRWGGEGGRSGDVPGWRDSPRRTPPVAGRGRQYQARPEFQTGTRNGIRAALRRGLCSFPSPGPASRACPAPPPST